MSRTGETVLPGFVDHHVHLGLVDPAGFAGSPIGGVVDLGWSPGVADLACPVPLAYAGCFLAAPGGYPSDRAWAPRDAVAEIASPAAAAAAVATQLGRGASAVKVTLNATAGPVPDLATLRAVVRAAGERPVVAHAEGAGMVALSLAAGVPVLAHVPWTERLGDDEVARCAVSQRWISTLDIHRADHARGDADPLPGWTPSLATALDNLRRFHAAGGAVLYGTDLGNGPLPVGLNRGEVALLLHAGLDEASVLAALTAPWPDGVASGSVTVLPAREDDQPLPAWLAEGRVRPGRALASPTTTGPPDRAEAEEEAR